MSCCRRMLPFTRAGHCLPINLTYSSTPRASLPVYFSVLRRSRIASSTSACVTEKLLPLILGLWPVEREESVSVPSCWTWIRFYPTKMQWNTTGNGMEHDGKWSGTRWKMEWNTMGNEVEYYRKWSGTRWKMEWNTMENEMEHDGKWSGTRWRMNTWKKIHKSQKSQGVTYSAMKILRLPWLPS